MSNHAQYLSPFFTEEREKLKKMFEDFFSIWDTRIALVGTGTSGILALGMIASIRTDIPIIIVNVFELIRY
jgi:ribulose 1,5-bisphosphate synthetase/thiazole synthase